MADRQTPSRRASGKRVESAQQTSTRRGTTEKQAPVRRNDVIRCERCGEDYSITYKRCPFCNERPDSRRIEGKKQVHPIQVISLVVSLVLIIIALFIVFKYVGPLLLGDGSGGGSSASTSQSGTSGDASLPPVTVDSIVLDQTELTLQVDEQVQLTATISPADSGAEVVWTSSQPNVLTVDEHGTVHNLNTSSSQVTVTVTAACGGQSAQCVVYCSGSGSAASGSESGTVAVVTNVGASGLNIRSGPGSNYEILASAMNGAVVVILEDTGTGWYKIDYGNGAIGYVSSDYVVPKN